MVHLGAILGEDTEGLFAMEKGANLLKDADTLIMNDLLLF